MPSRFQSEGLIGISLKASFKSILLSKVPGPNSLIKVYVCMHHLYNYYDKEHSSGLKSYLCLNLEVHIGDKWSAIHHRAWGPNLVLVYENWVRVGIQKVLKYVPFCTLS